MDRAIHGGKETTADFGRPSRPYSAITEENVSYVGSFVKGRRPNFNGADGGPHGNRSRICLANFPRATSAVQAEL